MNDNSSSRTMRMRRVLKSYIPKEHLSDEKLRVTSFDGTMWGDIERNTFDRVSHSEDSRHRLHFKTITITLTSSFGV